MCFNFVIFFQFFTFANPISLIPCYFSMASIARLIFEDGNVFNGSFFTTPKEVFGEIVFNTAMSGYQEVLTDPSYSNQCVVMTYPMIGNYGINEPIMNPMQFI